MSFDIKFTRQGFKNTCWHREACPVIQHAFSKPGPVNLISNNTNLIFYLSAIQIDSLFKLANITYDRFLCRFSVIDDVIQKVQSHHGLIKAHTVRLTTFIKQRATLQLIWEETDKESIPINILFLYSPDARWKVYCLQGCFIEDLTYVLPLLQI